MLICINFLGNIDHRFLLAGTFYKPYFYREICDDIFLLQKLNFYEKNGH